MANITQKTIDEVEEMGVVLSFYKEFLIVIDPPGATDVFVGFLDGSRVARSVKLPKHKEVTTSWLVKNLNLNVASKKQTFVVWNMVNNSVFDPLVVGRFDTSLEAALFMLSDGGLALFDGKPRFAYEVEENADEFKGTIPGFDFIAAVLKGVTDFSSMYPEAC